MLLIERIRYKRMFKYIDLSLRPVSYLEDRELTLRGRARNRRMIQHIRGIISKAKPDLFNGNAVDPVVEQMTKEAQADARSKQARNELLIMDLVASKAAEREAIDALIQQISSKISELTDEITAVQNEMKGVDNK